VEGSDTHYCSGEEIRAGDLVKSADWTGHVVFVLGTGSFAPGYSPEEWSYLTRGFMIEYDQAGLVFSEHADEDLVLVARAEPKAPADDGGS
jgi:hypothetical protein